MEGVTRKCDDIDNGNDSVKLAKTFTRSTVSGALF